MANCNIWKLGRGVVAPGVSSIIFAVEHVPCVFLFPCVCECEVCKKDRMNHIKLG